MIQNLNLTKEEAIDLYLKILKSDNREFSGGDPFSFTLYRKRTPLVSCRFVHARNDWKALLSINHLTFELESDEAKNIESSVFSFQTTMFSKEEILKAL